MCASGVPAGHGHVPCLSPDLCLTSQAPGVHAQTASLKLWSTHTSTKATIWPPLYPLLQAQVALRMTHSEATPRGPGKRLPSIWAGSRGTQLLGLPGSGCSCPSAPSLLSAQEGCCQRRARGAHLFSLLNLPSNAIMPSGFIHTSCSSKACACCLQQPILPEVGGRAQGQNTLNTELQSLEPG